LTRALACTLICMHPFPS